MPNRRQPDSQPTKRPRAYWERWELLGHIQTMLEPVMVALGVVFLVLLLIDLGGLVQGDFGQALLSRSQTAIWAIFLADFALRLMVAPAKLRFLRENWLSALSLALPFLRPLRALRAVRALRSLSLVRLLGGVNRGMRVLRRVSAGNLIAYVVGLTTLVALAGAVGVWHFDRGVEGSPITSFGDALWWSTALVTTINNEKYAVSVEARVIGILIRVYAISVFGYITASIASYLLGRPGDASVAHDTASGEVDIDALRHEVAALRRELREARLAAQLSAYPRREPDATMNDRTGD